MLGKLTLMNEMENVIQIVSSLIPNVGQIDEIEYLPGGYNNDNFRVTIKDEIFVVRSSEIHVLARLKKSTSACRLRQNSLP